MSSLRHPLIDPICDEVVETLARRRKHRGSTYRLQFNATFTFRDAIKIIPYLRSLGITHVYASPYLTAQPGSPHGYDVCRPDQLNPEIGSAEDYQAFVQALNECGLGQILDVVPNHMAASTHNPWWVDVLENGQSSPYARFFDIDWKPVKEELAGKVLLPILGEQYGNVLESGQLKLDIVEGAFVIGYCDHALPVGPKTTIPVLEHRIEELRPLLQEDSFLEYQSIITALQHLPKASETAADKMVERQREKEVIRRRLRRLLADEPSLVGFLQRTMEEFNGSPGDPHNFDRLDELLRVQSYRLCHWRSASDEVNYRRFFDVNGLAAICQESTEVFERTHRLVMQLLARGDLDGLRIDHIDGLLDPTRYLWRLQWAYVAELAYQAYARRVGIAEPDIFNEVPPLAIMRTDSPSAPVQGSVAAIVADNAIDQGSSDTSFESSGPVAILEAPPPPSSWSDLRRQVMRSLCDRLKLPYPDSEILGRGQLESLSESELADDNAQYERSSPSASELPLYVVVEKILGPDEPIPHSWPVAGTTGYDFLQLANGLLIERDGFNEIVRIYERFIGEKVEFSEMMVRCKQQILRFSMSSELQMLAHQLNRISEHDRRSRDFTLNMLRLALRETLANFPVYRTYAGPAGVSERDVRFTNQAIARAKRRSLAADGAMFDFLRGILLLEFPADLNAEERRRRELFAGRFQQVTSPVMAKGVEDTAFYLYCPLVSVNEVGSHPDVAPVSIESFHEDNVKRLDRFPSTMLATSTHDTKRSEDLRARINVLAEIPTHWRKACQRWLRLNRRFHREADGLPAPSRVDEYFLYQTLVGFWPLETPDAEAHADLISRLQAYMEKATHEAKARTSWVNPNTAYDDAMREFIGSVLERRKTNHFLTDFEKFHASVVELGLYTALSQVALKLLSPGVPDIFQSQEVWDFSLVDPDNRRPVDYEQRASLLSELQTRESNRASLALELAKSPRDPKLKLFVTWKLLELRRQFDKLFTTGGYVPLVVSGASAQHVCAFAWQWQLADGEMQQVVVAIPRLLGQLGFSADAGQLPGKLWSAETWGDTKVDYAIPAGSRFKSLFTGNEVQSADHLQVGPLFAEFPLIVLVSE